MLLEEYKTIFNQVTEDILKQGESHEERKGLVCQFIVDTERKSVEDWKIARTKIAAARSFLKDVKDLELLDRKLKESKIDYETLGIDPNSEEFKQRQFALEGKEGRKSAPKQTEQSAQRTAILACKKLPGFTAEKILGMLKGKYPKLTLEEVQEIMK